MDIIKNSKEPFSKNILTLFLLICEINREHIVGLAWHLAHSKYKIIICWKNTNYRNIFLTIWPRIYRVAYEIIYRFFIQEYHNSWFLKYNSEIFLSIDHMTLTVELEKKKLYLNSLTIDLIADQPSWKRGIFNQIDSISPCQGEIFLIHPFIH